MVQGAACVCAFALCFWASELLFAGAGCHPLPSTSDHRSSFRFPRSSCLPPVQGVQGISDIITIPGLVNVDFADVKAIMSNSGTAMLGVGVSSGKNRAEEAALVSFQVSG